jgi:hypothetical protein
LDADEILIYPYWDSRDLHALTTWLDRQGRPMLGAMMLDMYPQGPLAAHPYRAGDDPFETLCWFDATNYGIRIQQLPSIDVTKLAWLCGAIWLARGGRIA